jgi:hypothetical protein
MSTFDGQLYKGEDMPPERAHVQIEDGRCRLFTDRRRLGSWDLDEVKAERVGVLRFNVSAGELKFAFQPNDPTGFSQAIGATVDLRSTKSRFGLADRVRAATGRN